MDNVQKSGIVTGLQNLWNSSQYSDMTVRSGSEEFKVHRAILCPRSKFFATACNGPFQEGKTGVITLQDDDTPTVRRMLEYLYTDNYDGNGEAASVASYPHGKGANANLQATPVTEEEQLSAHDPPGYHELLNNIAVYVIADKYDIPDLEMLAATKFENALQNSGMVASLPAIIDAVFDATSDTKCELRNIVTKYCSRRKEEIIDSEDAVAIMRDHLEIGVEMIRQMVHERKQEKSSMEARIARMVVRDNALMQDIQGISQTANSIRVSDSRQVQQSYIDTQQQRLKDLREAIQHIKDCLNFKKK